MNLNKLNNIYSSVVNSDSAEQLHSLKSSLSKMAMATPALLLVSAVPADGQVICNDGAAPIVASGTYYAPSLLYFDVDGDGVDDFGMYVGTSYSFGTTAFFFDNYFAASNEFIVESLPIGPFGTFPLVANLSSGFSVGPLLPAGYAQQDYFINLVGSAGGYPFGDWLAPNNNGFVGLNFDIAGERHFGWVELTLGFPDITTGTPTTITIEGFCYESTPDTGLLAGEREAPPEVAPIPTVGEWGLITLALLLLSFGTVTVMRKEGALSMAGASMNVGLNKPVFSSEMFKKALPYTIALGALLSVGSWITTGTITTVDIFGGLIAGSVLTYWAHLVMMFKKDEE